ncbi:hypothetical protein D3C78_529760 [compost metagenome]
MMQLQGVQHLLAGGEIQMAEALLQLEDLQAVASLDYGAGPLVKRRLLRIEFGQDLVLIAQDQAFGMAHVHGLSHWKMNLGPR